MFELPRSQLTLLSGHTAPFKKVALAGLTDEAFQATLAGYAAA